ncbi:hypothetical protein LV89_04834 [Arcicella aurantiaca]|uniref:Uncharacterized protein n=1 Tax=Arcicella aurantiaca TaxID=591202 RepID=A0A316DGC7_9BACT|nr:hypothetical protein [Arcicella aurantiaca]PWK16668.1 hypothetical protein LV89_04834 [Arcicella aurantiaca]
MKLNLKYAILFLISFNSTTYAQDALSNKEIINLQASKISQDIILAKINSTKCQFDLTAQGLIELRAGKVSDRVVKSMFIASPPTEIITNEEVIKLSNSDVSTTILKEKINKTAHKFDVDPNDLIKLKSAKVSDSVVKEMILNPKQGVTTPINTKATIPVGTTNVQPDPSISSVSQSSNNSQKKSNNDIIVTTVYEEVKNLKRIGDISASASKVFGKQEKLKNECCPHGI